MKQAIISTIIANNQPELAMMINNVQQFVDRIQLDIMDGVFVPNPSLYFDFELPAGNTLYEAHLMIHKPAEWINTHGHKVDILLVHIETIDDPQQVISLAKQKGKKIGFALNPETPLDAVIPYLDQLDQVLFMTVQPGFYGSPFLPKVLPKIRDLRNLQPDIDIEVDGSINKETIAQAKKAGVNLFSVGSYIMKASDKQKAVAELKNIMYT